MRDLYGGTGTINDQREAGAMTHEEQDLQRADTDGMIDRREDEGHPVNTDPPKYVTESAPLSDEMLEVLVAADHEIALHLAALSPPARSALIALQAKKDKREAHALFFGSPTERSATAIIAGREPSAALTIAATGQGGALSYYRCKCVSEPGAVAEWTIEETVDPGGEFVLVLYENPEVGLQVQAFTDGLGSLRRFLETNIMDWWASAPRPRGADDVERDLREHGVLATPLAVVIGTRVHSTQAGFEHVQGTVIGFERHDNALLALIDWTGIWEHVGPEACDPDEYTPLTGEDAFDRATGESRR